ncbi:45 kDa calcium-binding protein-like [Tubulanus polymorphus]|uniref:45 kDa calcium-binding protein-like n=1 Tax=Tubulanus polymorphus TaxID=672921 RepID=UPI003DA400AC
MFSAATPEESDDIPVSSYENDNKHILLLTGKQKKNSSLTMNYKKLVPSLLFTLLLLNNLFTVVHMKPVPTGSVVVTGGDSKMTAAAASPLFFENVAAAAKARIKPDELESPKHMDAVKLEKDGRLNRDYRKEVFLGNHEEIELGTEVEQKLKLRDIFHRVDYSKDGLISMAELEEWIEQKVQEHFDETNDENEKIFKALDPDNDGFITWHEFFVQFLVAKGHQQDESEKHAADYETIDMGEKEKDMLIKNKFRWSEADEDPQDNKLNIQEFKNFRHPEQSDSMLRHMVNDILSNLDRDRDGVLTESEFIALPPGEAEGQSDWLQQEKVWQEERRKEFQNVIDVDKDGKVTKEELKNYVDPKNPGHAKMEVVNLMELADANKDQHLSLEEVMNNQDLFMGSKMVNAGRNFHDEF